jgi:hypothetical protein
LTSLWRGRLAGKLERSGPFSVRFPAFVTSYKGPRAGFVNLCRRFQVSGNLSSFRIPFVYDPEKSTRGILKTLCLSPVPILSLAAVHAVNLSEDQKHDVPKKCGF